MEQLSQMDQVAGQSLQWSSDHTALSVPGLREVGEDLWMEEGNDEGEGGDEGEGDEYPDGGEYPDPEGGKVCLRSRLGVDSPPPSW